MSDHRSRRRRMTRSRGYAHQKQTSNPHGPEGTRLGPRRGGDGGKPPVPPAMSAESAALESVGLTILAEIITSLERTRDAHKGDMDGAIARLRQVQEFAVKASEKAPNAPRQRAPHTVGGFLIV